MVSRHLGWDSFCPAPGTHDKMFCRVCDEELVVSRDVVGPTSFVQSLAKSSSLHDHFYCRHSGEDWHRQALTLKNEQNNTVSSAIREILEAEIAQIIATRQTTDGWTRQHHG